MALWVAVHGFTDDMDNVADTFNQPLFELVERTNFLYDRLAALYGAGTFEAVRLLDVPVDAAATIGSIVYRDPVTGTFKPAQASISLADNFTIADSTFALGVLITTNGTLGTVILAGRCDLQTSLTPWTLSDLVEPGELFRAGPYYLSSLTAGRITAFPKGPVIYVGYFGTDYAILAPQYRDTAEAHRHLSYPLFSQPAGSQKVTDPEMPTGTHAILGFPPVVVDGTATQQPFVVVRGTYTDVEPVQYTPTLGGTLSTVPPTDFSDAKLYWTSSDPLEGSGSVRVTSFESPVTIGTRGLTVTLENQTGTNYSVPYQVTSDSQDKRTWIVQAPADLQGWVARRYRIAMTPLITDNGFRFQVTGGPASYADNRVSDLITISCPGYICTIPFTEPTAAQTTVIGTNVFEYIVAGGTVGTPGHLPVELTGTPALTMANLQTAVIGAGDSTSIPVLGAANMYLGTPHSTITHKGATITGVATAGSFVGTAKLLVFDQNMHTLIDTGIWGSGSWYGVTALNNGLSIIPVPYRLDGTPLSSPNCDAGDFWAGSIIDEAPGAAFEYALSMHPSLAQQYPPIPMKSATFVLNGVELDAEGMFDLDPTYRLGFKGLYWYSDAYGMVPWPADWTSRTSPGSAHMRQNAVLHTVRNTGPSGSVTSLRPAPGSPVTIKRCGTADDATVGDLEINIDLGLSTTPAGIAGYQVVKASKGSKLQLGPVVERILPGPGVTVSQNSGAPNGQGIVTIGLAGDTTYTGDFDEVSLQNAKEEVMGMFPYIRLLPYRSTVPTGFISKFKVPYSLDPSVKYRVIFYATIFGDTGISGTPVQYGGLKFTYSFLPGGTDIQPGDSMLGLNNAYTSPAKLISVPFGSATDPFTAYTANDPFLLHNDVSITNVPNKTVNAGFREFPIPAPDFASWGDPNWACVRAGSMVGIQIQRTAGTPLDYTGSIGFINLRWKLVPVI